VKDNFEQCLAITLAHEGGWADHPKDPGGATMKGVTIGTYAQFKGRKVTKDELRNISDADLRAIYRRNYWNKVRGDDLPAGLDLVAFDGAVNSGPPRGARWLQHGVGALPDGKIGPETVRAAAITNAARAIGRACDARLSFLRSLKTWATFGKGWSSRVEDIRAKAVGMVPHVSETPEMLTRPAPHVNAPDHFAGGGNMMPPAPAPRFSIIALLRAALALFFGGKK